MSKSSMPALGSCTETRSMLDQSRSSLKIEWLDSKTAASYLGISVPTLLNMTSNGQVPFYKLGRRNRYNKDELDSLLLQSRKGSYGNKI